MYVNIHTTSLAITAVGFGKLAEKLNRNNCFTHMQEIFLLCLHLYQKVTNKPRRP